MNSDPTPTTLVVFCWTDSTPWGWGYSLTSELYIKLNYICCAALQLFRECVSFDVKLARAVHDHRTIRSGEGSLSRKTFSVALGASSSPSSWSSQRCHILRSTAWSWSRATTRCAWPPCVTQKFTWLSTFTAIKERCFFCLPCWYYPWT